jgi:hypothetical protein
MKRKLFTILAAVSLMVMALSIAGGLSSRSGFWVRHSALNRDRASFRQWSCFGYRGRCVVTRGTYYLGQQQQTSFVRGWQSGWLRSNPSLDRWWIPTTFGFGLAQEEERLYGYEGSYAGYGLCFPFWALVVVAAILPVCKAILLWHKLTCIQMGRCVTCGYDVRATPQRCPECGTPSTSSGQDVPKATA